MLSAGEMTLHHIKVNIRWAHFKWSQQTSWSQNCTSAHWEVLNNKSDLMQCCNYVKCVCCLLHRGQRHDCSLWPVGQGGDGGTNYQPKLKLSVCPHTHTHTRQVVRVCRQSSPSQDIFHLMKLVCSLYGSEPMKWSQSQSIRVRPFSFASKMEHVVWHLFVSPAYVGFCGFSCTKAAKLPLCLQEEPLPFHCSGPLSKTCSEAKVRSQAGCGSWAKEKLSYLPLSCQPGMWWILG